MVRHEFCQYAGAGLSLWLRDVYKRQVLAYQKAMEQYRTRGGQKPPEEESIREQLQRLAEEAKRNEVSRKISVKKEKGDR